MICKSFENYVIIESSRALGKVERECLTQGGHNRQTWNGETWSNGDDFVEVSDCRMTDYDVTPGLWIYRSTHEESVEVSEVIKVGADKIGWTFGNYECAETWGEVLTADDLRFTYLWGVDFRASNGEIFTDCQIRFTVDSALAEIERTLSYHFKKKTVKCESPDGDIEESGYRIKNHRGMNIVQLRHVPVLSLERIEFYDYTDSKVTDLLDTCIIDKTKGVVEVRPKNTFGGVWNVGLFHGGGFVGRDSRFPVSSGYRNAFKADYTVGVENAGKVPEDVRDIVGKVAACKLLNAIGDGLIAGFSSSGLSMDGLSESFSSTQSATSAYFGARIKVYEENIAAWKKENARKFRKWYIGML